MKVNLKLVGHKTYVFQSVVYHSGHVVAVPNDLAEELLSHQTDDFEAVFVQTDEEVGESTETKAKPMRKMVFGTKKDAADKPAGGRGSVSGKGGVDMKTLTV